MMVEERFLLAAERLRELQKEKALSGEYDTYFINMGLMNRIKGTAENSDAQSYLSLNSISTENSLRIFCLSLSSAPKKP